MNFLPKPVSVLVTLTVMVIVLQGCEKSQPTANAPEATPVSAVEVRLNPSGPLVIITAVSEFDLTPKGYVQAFLLRNGQRLTLDDPSADAAGSTATIAGKHVRDFAFDWNRPAVSAVTGKLGALGKRIDVTGHSASSGLDETISVEVYDDFPTMALVTAVVRNASQKDILLDAVSVQEHRINANLADAKAAPHQLWSFQGASYDWGQDEILPLPAHFSRPNLMGAGVKDGAGGGILVNAFWTASVGGAIGHVETLPLVLSLPVSVGADQRINTGLNLDAKTTLKPGDSFATPRSFVAVYHGDFYKPLRTYSLALQKEDWPLPHPHNQA